MDEDRTQVNLLNAAMFTTSILLMNYGGVLTNDEFEKVKLYCGDLIKIFGGHLEPEGFEIYREFVSLQLDDVLKKMKP